MLKEVIMILWVCSPVPGDAPIGVKPICAPEALMAAFPTDPQQLPFVCQALNEAARKRWGPTGSEQPKFARPLQCIGMDYTGVPGVKPEPSVDVKPK